MLCYFSFDTALCTTTIQVEETKDTVGEVQIRITTALFSRRAGHQKNILYRKKKLHSEKSKRVV